MRDSSVPSKQSPAIDYASATTGTAAPNWPFSPTNPVADIGVAGDERPSSNLAPHISQMLAKGKTQMSPPKAENGKAVPNTGSQGLGLPPLRHAEGQVAASQETSSLQAEVCCKRDRDLHSSGQGQVKEGNFEERESGDTDDGERIKAAFLTYVAGQTSFIPSTTRVPPTEQFPARKRRWSFGQCSTGREKRSKHGSEEGETIRSMRLQPAARMTSAGSQGWDPFNVTIQQIPERRRSTALENMRAGAPASLPVNIHEEEDLEKDGKIANNTHTTPVADGVIEVEDKQTDDTTQSKRLPDKVCRKVAENCYHDQDSLRALRLVSRSFNEAASMFLFGHLVVTLGIHEIGQFFNLVQSQKVSEAAKLCKLDAILWPAAMTGTALRQNRLYMFHSFKLLQGVRMFTFDFRCLPMRSRVDGPCEQRDQQIWLAATGMQGLGRSEIKSCTFHCIDDQDMAYVSAFNRSQRCRPLRKDGSMPKHAFSRMRGLYLLNWQPSTDRHEECVRNGARSGLSKILVDLDALEKLVIYGANIAQKYLPTPAVYLRMPYDDLGYGVSEVLQHLELKRVTIDTSSLCRLIRRCCGTLREVRLNVALELGRWSVVFSTMLSCPELIEVSTCLDGLWVTGDKGSRRTGYLEENDGRKDQAQLDEKAAILAAVDRRKLGRLICHIQKNRKRVGLPDITSEIWKQYELFPRRPMRPAKRSI